jgi:hypothetical protein
MRRLLLLLAFVTLFKNTHAQTLQEKLYYTCKVWGFVKYYHSEVSVCNVNWDSVLLHILPKVRAATTSAQFNDALDSMLAAAGPMAISTTYFPDTLPPALKRNRDWDWISSPALRADVKIQLDTIKNNFRPHASCWVQLNTWGSGYLGYLRFPKDSLAVNTYTTFPSQDSLVLIMAQYWNIIRYFNPYNYVMDVPWDSVLYNRIVPATTAPNACAFYREFRKIATHLNDGHGYGLNNSSGCFNPPGFYRPYVRLKYMGGQYIVIRSALPGISPGDAIVSVDGLTPTQWEDSLRPYIPASNDVTFRKFVADDMMAREINLYNEAIVTQDFAGVIHTTYAPCINWYADPAFFTSFYYPNDSLNTIKWSSMQCDIGYVNMGNLTQSDVGAMYSDLRYKSAIIFDLRNYPKGTAWPITDLMYPTKMYYARFSKPDLTYPGTQYWEDEFQGSAGNPTAYGGQVIILMDEITLSQAEYSCMMICAMPGTIKVGSQTSGADGDITYWSMSKDLHGGFSTLGVYYPNGDSTQRIGIVPDSFAYPTKEGVRHSRDYVLERALKIAGCNLSVAHNNTQNAIITIHPNPANDVVGIEADNTDAEKIAISISDVTGRILLHSTIENNGKHIQTTFSLKDLSAGIYLVKVTDGEHSYVSKLVKK